MEYEPVIVVHGGASAIPHHMWLPKIEGVKESVLRGYKVLASGGSALDAVEAAVISMEDSPYFNAGKGSALTYDEQVEMDALVMDGTTMNAGAVAAIQNVANPIKVARLVMEKTPHALLVGEAAGRFAKAHGIKEVSSDQLVTEDAKKRLRKYMEYNRTVKCAFDKTDNDPEILENSDVSGGSVASDSHDTVGAVALDKAGHIASATSTGGITAKMPGRVGDTPIIGAGGYADDEVGGISTTGHGESIMRACLARQIAFYMESGKDTSEAIQLGLDHMEHKIKGYGGAIAVSKGGSVAASFSTIRMAWAYIKKGSLYYGIHRDQKEAEAI